MFDKSLHAGATRICSSTLYKPPNRPIAANQQFQGSGVDVVISGLSVAWAITRKRESKLQRLRLRLY